MRLEEGLQAWGYPLSIKERGTERPVEERKERRKILAQLLKALTGIQEPPERQKPRKIVSRGAQHSELLRWVIVYSERIRELIRDEPTREVAVRDGDAPLKVYTVTFGEERELTGANWRFYFVAAMMITLEAANYQRALGQSQYIRLDPRSLKTDMELYGVDATLIQSEKAWLLKVSRHDRKLEAGFLEDRLREMDYQRAQITYRNRLCVTVHKGNIYRIIDITDTTADRATFDKGGATITVAQYFKDAYNENVEGKQVIMAKEARGGSRLCYLPVNLLRVIAQAPQPVEGSRAMVRPKSAQETLVECTELVKDILRTPAVKEQMAELKVHIGDNGGLPIDVQKDITSLRKVMGEEQRYGEPRISWGPEGREEQQDTFVELTPDFRARLCQHLVLRHKVPLSSHWMLVVCTGRREHGSSRAVESIKNTIELTRQRIRHRGQLTVDMEAPACCEHFIRSEADWKKGRVERTKRSLRDLFIKQRHGLRGAIILLAYDSDDTNNRVRVAAKQVSVQQDFPIQCCKLQTLQAFKSRPEDKSMNMWWNVYLQFQTKITDDSLHAGVPWVADQLLAPIREGVRPPQISEVVRAIGIAVNSFGPPNARCGVVGIVGGRNVAHTQFMSHIGASAPTNYRAGVIKDMARHFKLFWEKLTFEETTKPHKHAPAHILIYRSAPSGSSQIKEVLAQEVTAIKSVLGADLGNFEFSPETSELTIEHPMATAFPDAEFAVVLTVCSVDEMRRSTGKAEEVSQHSRPRHETLTCQGATIGSDGRHILKFKLEEGTVPLLQAMAILVSEFDAPEPEAFQLEEGEDGKRITLPEDHPLLVYAKSNSRWLKNIELQFTTTADGPLDGFKGVIVPVNGEIYADINVRETASSPRTELRAGDTIYLRQAAISQLIQKVFINVLVNPHRPANPMKFFMKGREGVQGLPVGAYIDSGPIIPVAPNTEMPEEKFLIGTADPTRGSPSASEFHIAQNESDWSKHYLAVVSYKLCHMYYNWAGTVKHPHVLQMALAIVRQHSIYIASESGFGLESEFAPEEPPEEEPPPERPVSPELGEEPEIRERVQKRRQEVGQEAFAAGTREQRETAEDIEERNAGLENLKELKATLENKDSVLMTTAFML